MGDGEGLVRAAEAFFLLFLWLLQGWLWLFELSPILVALLTAGLIAAVVGKFLYPEPGSK